MKRSIPALILLFGVVCLLSSCKKEDIKIITNDGDVNKWIYNNIRENYLWSAEIPAFENTDATLSPPAYFNSQLRYRVNLGVDYNADTYGDRFSYISRKNASTRADDGTEYGTGMTFGTVGNSATGKVDYGIVLVVHEGSPAASQGIKRGDCFNAVGGTTFPVTTSEFTSLLSAQTQTISFFYPEQKQVTVTAGSYTNDPVLSHEIFEDIQPKTAYLAYDQFPDGSIQGFRSNLMNIFNGFKDEGVENLILDLRYNGGGYLSSARLLTSLIVPTSLLGKTYIYKETNKNFGNPANFDAENLMSVTDIGNSNMGARNLYVLTGYGTASASELVIHALDALEGVNVTVIGETTYGKNVGSSTISSALYEWEVTPMSIRIYNVNKVSGYETGIAPQGKNEIKEAFDRLPFNWSRGDQVIHMYPFGDHNDPLVARAIEIITGENPRKNAPEIRSRSATASGTLRVPFIDRGLMMD